MEPANLIEFPLFLGGEHSGNRALNGRPTRGPKAEIAWTREVMAANNDWHDVVGIQPFQSYDLEYPICSYRDLFGDTMGVGRARGLGLPNVDGRGVYADGTVCILEAKLDCSSIEMLRGVAQLLYYKFLMETLEGARVSSLVLASPSWPAYVIDVINEYRLPVRLLKVTSDGVFGSVPLYLAGEQP
jgi:hypothetical protein